MNYKTVFQVTDKPILDIFDLIPLVFLVIGIGVAIFHFKNNKDTSHEKTLKIFKGIGLSILGLIIFLLTFPSSLSNKIDIDKIYETKGYQVIEGVIENFHPMPYNGHEMESFTVNNVYFEYSDFVVQYGFNNTSSHGGPIVKNGQQVRLSYITIGKENRILKIEIGD